MRYQSAALQKILAHVRMVSRDLVRVARRTVKQSAHSVKTDGRLTIQERGVSVRARVVMCTGTIHTNALIVCCVVW